MAHTIQATRKTSVKSPSSNGIGNVPNFINGKFIEPAGLETLPVMNPSLGQQIGRVPLSTSREIDEAARSAQAALSSWSATPIKERSQIFYRYKTLLEKNLDELALQIH
ncbi:MAG: aldehyde dehydrogenase family protein, partial [Ignavibacteriales bacterium]|nr:aldehyde dehydrogenase family protein [Ignavibacteriales bacterium]